MFNYQFVKNNSRFLLFGFILTFCSSFGQTFFIGIFNPYIREDLSLSHSEFGLIYSLATLLSSLSLIWIGKKIDDLDKELYKELAAILKPDEIEKFKELDFTESSKEKKKRKKKGKN